MDGYFYVSSPVPATRCSALAVAPASYNFGFGFGFGRLRWGRILLDSCEKRGYRSVYRFLNISSAFVSFTHPVFINIY